ncbi:alpha/beta hydrolase [bacterium]|jgi:lysophospholipase|nr:alpha/beta hydrolase [bacterium]
MIHHDSQSRPKAPLIDIDSFNCPSGGDSFFYKTSDGVNLRIAIWNETSSKGTILLQSGRTEFIEKYYEVIQEFVNRGLCVALMDWRGQGLSDRVAKDIRIGHVDNFSDYDSDFEEVIRKIYQDSCPKPWIVMGHSMGGCLVASSAAKNTDLFDAIILCAPMLTLQMPNLIKKLIHVLGFMTKIGLKEKALARPEWHEDEGWRENPFKENQVTSDPIRYERTMMLIREHQEHAIGGLTVGWVYGALKRTREMISPGWIKKIEQPLLLLNATKDKLVNPKENVKICSQSNTVTIEDIDGEHEILMETDLIREQAWNAIDEFLKKTL